MACYLCIIHFVGSTVPEKKTTTCLRRRKSPRFEVICILLMVGNEGDKWEEVVEETQALNTVESLAEILQLKDKC